MSKLKDSCCIICNNNITDSSSISITDYMRPLSNSELSLYTFFQLISNFNQLDISEVPQNACDKCYQDALHVLDFQILCNKAVENIKTNSEDIERVCVGIDCDVDILYSSEEDTEDGYDVDIITNNSDNAKDEDSASLLASEPAIRKRKRKPDSQARLEKIAERIECKQCHKLYRRDYMLKHMRVHTGDKLPIKICKCKLCPAEFKDASSLKYHMQNHSDERPYKCEICGKTFQHKVIHRSHYATHSDARPFACSECPKKFRLNKTLKAHIVTQHAKNEPVECTFCGRRFTHKDGLRRHQTKSCHVLRNNDASLRP